MVLDFTLYQITGAVHLHKPKEYYEVETVADRDAMIREIFPELDRPNPYGVE
jgi:hypothetical protein